MLTIMGHFKSEARKEMNRPSQEPQNMAEQDGSKPPLFMCFQEGIEQKQTFEEMVLSSIKFDKLEFETLVLERVIFGKNSGDDHYKVWREPCQKAFFSKSILNSRAKQKNETEREVPLYAYTLPGSHLVNYLFKLFESKRRVMIKKKRPTKTNSLQKHRIGDDRV